MNLEDLQNQLDALSAKIDTVEAALDEALSRMEDIEQNALNDRKDI